MLQTAQQKPKALSDSNSTLGAKAQAQSIAKAIAKQIADEPFEIAKGVTEQLLGGPPPQASTDNPTLQAEPGVDHQKVRRKEAFHMQAFREELKQIQEMKRQREQNFVQSKQSTEQEQKQREEQKKEAVPVEAPGKQPKKGAGMMGKVKKQVTNMLESFRSKKSRGIETQKMPSN